MFTALWQLRNINIQFDFMSDFLLIGIPQAGLVTMVMVLQTVGLPSTDVALILAVEIMDNTEELALDSQIVQASIHQRGV